MKDFRFEQFSTALPLEDVAREAGALVVESVMYGDPDDVAHMSAYSRFSENKGYSSFALLEDGAVVATGAFGAAGSSKVATINHVAVQESRRKEGLGREIMARLEDAVVDSGYVATFVPAREDAREFYEKLGYTQSGYADEGHVSMVKYLFNRRRDR